MFDSPTIATGHVMTFYAHPQLCPGHWSLVSWLAFLRIPAPISVQHLKNGVAILMARLLQRPFSNSEPWSFYSGYQFWPSLFWQWVTPGYPVGCFRCRQLFVASEGAPRVMTLYSAATHRERCWKREVASLFSAFGNQIWLTWSSMRYFQQEVACVPGGDLQIYIARHMYRKFTG